MNITNSSREAEFETKQEGGGGEKCEEKISKASSSSSKPWSRMKDPRIVRVSRAFGGKDRHSKVCTVRGLRDRRVRLSVPTAIQLYDLQDRLGLNQPSKVVDWLLNAAKHEIDELPPLQIPQGCFSQNHELMLNSFGASANSQSNKEGLNLNSSINWSNLWNLDSNLRDKSKEMTTELEDGKEKWNQREEEEQQQQQKEGVIEGHGTIYGSSNFFPRPNHSPIPGLMNNFMPYNPFYRLDPSNYSIPHLVGSHGLTLQTEDLVPLSSTQSYFPSHVTTTTSMEFDDPKQINHYQMFGSSSSKPPPPPFNLSMATNLFPSQNSNVTHPNKEDNFPTK